MPILNFKKEFAQAVELGTKRTTIRATRRCPVKAGDTLYLYTGLRTKCARKLREERCISECSISLFPDKTVTMDNRTASRAQVQTLARIDGFDTENDFFRFFESTHGLPFTGQLIMW
jgi:hypothetical protein